MSQEQSIDDLLRLLKESVATDEESKDTQKKGKGRKKSDAMEDTPKDAYAIDPDFFNDVEPEEESEDTRAPWEDAPVEEEEELPVEEEEELPVEEEEELPVEEEEEISVEEEEELPVEEEEELPVEEEKELPVEEEEELPVEEEEEIPVEEEEELPVEEEEELPVEEEKELPVEEEEELPVEEEEELPVEEEEELPVEEEEELSVEEEEELPVEEEEELPVEEEEELPVEEEEELLVEEEEKIPVEEEDVPAEEEELLPFEAEDIPAEEESLFQENDYRELDAFLSEISDYFTTEESSEEQSIETLQTELAKDALCEEGAEDAFVPPAENLESIPLESLILDSEEETEEPVETEDAPISDAILGLMKQFGCEEEIPDLMRGESEESAQEPTTAKAPQDLKEEVLSERKKEKGYWLRLIGLGAVTLFLLIFDLIPFGEANLSGLLDFVEFPGAYLLVGLQILVFGIFCIWRPLWQGVKKLLHGSPDVYSALAVMLCFLIVYDLTLAFSLSEQNLPPMFHFVSSLMMLLVFGSEYMMHRRKVHLLEVMSREEALYTLIPSDGEQSLAEKMYRGGMNRSQRIYLPAVVSGGARFDVDTEETSVGDRFLKGSLIPISLLVIATAVVGMAFEQSLSASFVAAMIMLFATLPLSAVVAAVIPLWTSAAWMKKRGNALGNSSSIERYSECHVIVFRDLHLFRLCRMEETGIVFYDKVNATSVMAALEILYSHVGGPMKGIFGRVPEAYRAKSIRIRRIVKGGVEAFVDKKSVLLVGDYDFMKQYGIFFPRSEDSADRTTLYVSLDGRQSAKVNARYEIDPLFEMLVSRLAVEGIHCVVETYDPLIHSEFVGSMRRSDSAPISVVHKNAIDLYYQRNEGEPRARSASMVATMSRLKLAEALVWCRRIVKAIRRTEMLGFLFSGMGLIATALLFGFGALSSVHEYWLALYGLLPVLVVSAVIFVSFPNRLYFTEQAYAEELKKKDMKRARAKQKAEKKTKKK